MERLRKILQAPAEVLYQMEVSARITCGASFPSDGAAARPARHGSTQSSETPGGFPLNERFQSHANERSLFRLAGIFTGPTEQRIVDVECCSHAYDDA